MSHTCLSPGSTALPLQMSWKKRFCFLILMSFPFTLRSIDCVPVSFLSFFLSFFFYFWFFRDRVSLYSPGGPGTHFVDQAGLELRNPPASQVLGLKAYATTALPDPVLKSKTNKQKEIIKKKKPGGW